MKRVALLSTIVGFGFQLLPEVATIFVSDDWNWLIRSAGSTLAQRAYRHAGRDHAAEHEAGKLEQRRRADGRPDERGPSRRGSIEQGPGRPGGGGETERATHVERHQVTVREHARREAEQAQRHQRRGPAVQ